MTTPPDLPVEPPPIGGEEAMAQLKAGMRRARRILADTRRSLTAPGVPDNPDGRKR